MSKYLRYLRGGLDRSKNPLWGRKASILYAFGAWTVLGVFFIKWKMNDFDVSGNAGLPKLTTEEKEELRVQQKKRNEETSIHVAENVYTPLDFMS